MSSKNDILISLDATSSRILVHKVACHDLFLGKKDEKTAFLGYLWVDNFVIYVYICCVFIKQ